MAHHLLGAALTGADVLVGAGQDVQREVEQLDMDVRLRYVDADQRTSRRVDGHEAPGAAARRVLEPDLGDHPQLEEFPDERGDRGEAQPRGGRQLLPGGG